MGFLMCFFDVFFLKFYSEKLTLVFVPKKNYSIKQLFSKINNCKTHAPHRCPPYAPPLLKAPCFLHLFTSCGAFCLHLLGWYYGIIIRCKILYFLLIAGIQVLKHYLHSFDLLFKLFDWHCFYS